MVAPSAGSWLKEAIDKVLATCTWKIVSLRTPKLQRRSVEWSTMVQYIVSAEEVQVGRSPSSLSFQPSTSEQTPVATEIHAARS